YFDYQGPDIQRLKTVDAFQKVWDWFQAQGGTKAADLVVAARFPGFDIAIPKSLASPHVDEWTIGVGSRIGVNGYVRADVIHRDWADFYVQRIDSTTGRFHDPLGLGVQTDQAFIENDDGSLERYYNGVSVQ